MTDIRRVLHEPVEVNAAAFLEAVSKLPQTRIPGSSKRGVPKDTQLTAADGGIMVDTPVMGTLVHSKPQWRESVSVDARKLLELCQRYKRLDAYRDRASTFLISVADGELRVRFQTTIQSLPLLPPLAM